MVCGSAQHDSSSTGIAPSPVPTPTAVARYNTPVVPQPEAGGFALVRDTFTRKGVSAEVTDFLLRSWRDGTQVQYSHYIQRWMSFCCQQQINALSPTLVQVLTFLHSLFKSGKADGSGLSYSALNTARSALSTLVTIDGMPIGQHPMIKRFMKATFNVRPALPKNIVTWDVDCVLNYLKTLQPSSALSLLMLSQKLTMLLVLLAGQRGQSIHLLDIVNMTLTDNFVAFRLAELTKTSRPNFHQQQLFFNCFDADHSLCVVRITKDYLNRTAPLRGEVKQLFVATTPPHQAVSRDTIRRWTKNVMVAAGVDMNMFTVHSTRSAATSKVASKLPMKTILATAGWSRPSTFQRFYNKPLENATFANAILNG